MTKPYRELLQEADGRSVMLDDIAGVLDELHEFVESADTLLSGRDNVNIIEMSRDLDRAVEQVRKTIEPLTHPINNDKDS